MKQLSILLCAGNGDHSTPDGDGLRGSNPFDRSKSNDPAAHKSQMSLDWREFRANLFAREQVILLVCLA